MSSTLRILLVADYPDDPTLGSSKVAHKLREELGALGHRCDVVFTEEIGGRMGRNVRQGLAPALAARAIARRFAGGSYDVVEAASAEGLWFGAAKKLGWHRGTALVCRSNGLEHLNYARMVADHEASLTRKPWTRRIWYPLSRLSQVSAAARVSDRLIVLTESDRGFAVSQGWLPPDRIDVVPHGLSEIFRRELPAAERRGGGLLFCGTWDHAKGIAYLVRAFERLIDRGHEMRLTILGPGVPAPVVRGAFSERARMLVTVIARVPEARVLEEYRRHDILVMPSTYEGFGLVVIEALSQHLPVIATPVGCAAELIRTGETGLLVSPRDADAIAAAIVQLMAAPELRRRLADNGARLVSGMSWRETARKTLDVYDRALASGRRHGAAVA